jgi:excisionase family DNA binding protein
MTEPLTISVEDAARLLGISRGLAYEAARRGEIPVIRLGRRLLVPRAPLYELVGATSFGESGSRREGVDNQAVLGGNDEAGDRTPASSPHSELKGASGGE